MPKILKTEFKRIGRSGPTVDGRIIEPITLEQAAASYNKDLFTALIWPDHLRWFNMGTVEALRTESNDEGGVDLFAVIAPNQFYLDSNKYGQRLFTSMELQPNFRDTGGYYLTGLAATDNPASAATTEMRFTAGVDKAVVLGAFTENTVHTFEQDTDQPPSWFFNLFKSKSDEDDMDKKALEALTEKFTAMEARLAKLAPADNAETPETPASEFAALSAKFDTLLEKFEALAASQTDAADTSVSADEFNTLKKDFNDLLEKFTTAVGEHNGTDAGEHTGTDEDLNKYL